MTTVEVPPNLWTSTPLRIFACALHVMRTARCDSMSFRARPFSLAGWLHHSTTEGLSLLMTLKKEMAMKIPVFGSVSLLCASAALAVQIQSSPPPAGAAAKSPANPTAGSGQANPPVPIGTLRPAPRRLRRPRQVRWERPDLQLCSGVDDTGSRHDQPAALHTSVDPLRGSLVEVGPAVFVQSQVCSGGASCPVEAEAANWPIPAGIRVSSIGTEVGVTPAGRRPMRHTQVITGLC